jgi:hypothetical protein
VTADTYIRATARAGAIDRDLRALVWLVVVVLSCGLSLFLTWRRIAGALVQPPSSAALVGAAIGLAIAATLMRRIWPLHTRRVGQVPGSTPRAWSAIAGPPSPGIDLPFALPGAVAVLVFATITLPGTLTLGITTAWLVLIGSEAASWVLHRRTELSGRRRTRSLPLESHEAQSADTDEEPEIPAGLVQKLTRVREPDRESIHALVQAEIPTGDRLAVVHLAFCPPLARSPELRAHVMETGDGFGMDDVEVRITQAESFGARIEVRVPSTVQQPRSVLVEIVGSVTVQRSA